MIIAEQYNEVREMKIILTRKNTRINAVGEFCPETKELTVSAGSIFFDEIHRTEKFRGAATIEKYRAEYVVDEKTVKDVHFRSASTATNFVTGSSPNGLIA